MGWDGMGWMDGSPGGRGYRAPYGANNINVEYFEYLILSCFLWIDMLVMWWLCLFTICEQTNKALRAILFVCSVQTPIRYVDGEAS